MLIPFGGMRSICSVIEKSIFLLLEQPYNKTPRSLKSPGSFASMLYNIVTKCLQRPYLGIFQKHHPCCKYPLYFGMIDHLYNFFLFLPSPLPPAPIDVIIVIPITPSYRLASCRLPLSSSHPYLPCCCRSGELDGLSSCAISTSGTLHSCGLPFSTRRCLVFSIFSSMRD